MHPVPDQDLRPEEIWLSNAYDAFNQRDVDTLLAMMHPEVNWPNGMEGGIEHGREAVRSYWTRQWSMIDPHVEPVNFETMEDGKIDITVHQTVKDLTGNILIDENVHHIYTVEDGLIHSMEIKK
jgi:hypothetical protein